MNSQKVNILSTSSLSDGRIPRSENTSNSKSMCFTRRDQAQKSSSIMRMRMQRTFTDGRSSNVTATLLIYQKPFYQSSKLRILSRLNFPLKLRFTMTLNATSTWRRERNNYRVTCDKFWSVWLTECHHICWSSLGCTIKIRLGISMHCKSRNLLRSTWNVTC